MSRTRCWCGLLGPNLSAVPPFFGMNPSDGMCFCWSGGIDLCRDTILEGRNIKSAWYAGKVTIYIWAPQALVECCASSCYSGSSYCLSRQVDGCNMNTTSRHKYDMIDLSDLQFSKKIKNHHQSNIQRISNSR